MCKEHFIALLGAYSESLKVGTTVGPVIIVLFMDLSPDSWLSLFFYIAWLSPLVVQLSQLCCLLWCSVLGIKSRHMHYHRYMLGPWKSGVFFVNMSVSSNINNVLSSLLLSLLSHLPFCPFSPLLPPSLLFALVLRKLGEFVIQVNFVSGCAFPILVYRFPSLFFLVFLLDHWLQLWSLCHNPLQSALRRTRNIEKQKETNRNDNNGSWSRV